MEYHLRRASESDKNFLYSIHRATMRDVIEKTWGWDEAWQRNDFETRFKECLVSIIEADGRDVGSLWLRSRPELLYIVDLCGDMGSVLNPCIIWKPRAMPCAIAGEETGGFQSCRMAR